MKYIVALSLSAYLFAVPSYGQEVMSDDKLETLRSMCREADLEIASVEQQIEACSKIITSNAVSPKDLSNAYYNRGSKYADNGDFPRAIADYDEAIRINPKDQSALFDRAFYLYIMENYEEAIEGFIETIAINPKDSQAFHYRANAYYATKAYDKALLDYNEYIRLDPGVAQAFFERGNTLDELNKLPEAIADYDEAIRLDPKFSNAFNNRGLVYRKL